MTKTFTSVVMRGNQLGRTIGFPTLNFDPEIIYPSMPEGVYVAKVFIKEKAYLGALYYGKRLVLGEDTMVLEVHVLDFDTDIYDKRVTCEIGEFIRGPMKFTSIANMKKQLKRDVKNVRSVGLHTPGVSLYVHPEGVQVDMSVVGWMGRGSLEEQCVIAKRAGFRGIDYVAGISDLFFTPEEILRVSRKVGIPVVSIHTPLFMALYTPPILGDRIIKVVERFEEVRHFNVHLSGYLGPFFRDEKSLEYLRAQLDRRGIGLSLESNPNEYVILPFYPVETRDPEAFAAYCKKQEYMMTYDSSHIADWGVDVVDFFMRHHRQISLLHLSDWTKEFQHLPFGKGDLPLERLFDAMDSVNYRGRIVCEISEFPKDIRIEEKIELLAEGVSRMTEKGK
jgi:sugar phosphate isomerase/epimerase